MAAVVDAGMFRMVLAFEKPTKVADEGYGNTPVYDQIWTCRGYARRLGGNKSFDVGYEGVVQEYEFFTHWRSAMDTEVNRDTRIIYENVSYEITSWERYEENRQFMRFVGIGTT